MNQEVLNQVIRILKEECLVETEISSDSNLFSDLALDSIGLITLLRGLENHFDITINQEELTSSPETVGEIAQFAEVFLEDKESL